MARKEDLQSFEPREYARLIELEEVNDYGLPAGRYLLTQDSKQVDVRAKLTLGHEAKTETVWRDEEQGVSLVKVTSHQ